MGKARTDKHGFTKEQRLHEENQKLKRQISSLRKQIARLDLDRFDVVKEMIEEHYQEDKEAEGKIILDKLKKSWACRECADGHLEIFVHTRGGEPWYWRVCSNAPNCGNKTKSQPYTPLVKGIMR